MAIWYEVEAHLVQVSTNGQGRNQKTIDKISIIPEGESLGLFPGSRENNLHNARAIFEQAKKIIAGEK